MTARRRSRSGRAAVIAFGAIAVAAACSRRAGEVDAGASGGASGALADGVTTVEENGVRIACTVAPASGAADARLRQGDKARVTLRVADAQTGRGIAGAKLGAWLVPRPVEVAGRAPDAATLRSVVRQLVGSGSAPGGATSLNAYYVLTLNTDRTLTTVDPAYALATTRMKQAIELPCTGSDLVLGPGNDLAFVALPERSAVAVVDPTDLTIRDTIQLAAPARRLCVQPVRGVVWALGDAGAKVVAIDGATGRKLGDFEVGTGVVDLAFDDEGRWTFAADRASGAIVRIDGSAGTSRHLCTLDDRLGGIAWSTAAGALHVVRSKGRVDVVDVETGACRPGAEVPADCGPLYAAPGGRWLFVLDRQGDRVHVVDAATGQGTRTITTAKGPDHMVFTPAFAYVHAAASRDLTLVQFGALGGSGPVPSLRIAIGQDDPTPAPDRCGPLIAPSPDRASVIVAAPDEHLLYYYAEGMTAPMGSFQNHGRTPTALAVLDRSLRELGDGVLTAEVPLEYAGVVDLYVYLDQPAQVYGRFPLQIEASAASVEQQEARAPHAVPEPLQPTTTVPVGRDAELRFRLRDRESGKPVAGIDDLRALVRGRFGNWQRRNVPVEALADGTYRVPLSLPQVGVHLVHLQSRSCNLMFDNHRALEVTATDDVEAQVPAVPSAAAPQTAR